MSFERTSPSRNKTLEHFHISTRLERSLKTEKTQLIQWQHSRKIRPFVSFSWLERSIHNADVGGSNPPITTKIKTHSLTTVGFFFVDQNIDVFWSLLEFGLIQWLDDLDGATCTCQYQHSAKPIAYGHDQSTGDHMVRFAIADEPNLVQQSIGQCKKYRDFEKRLPIQSVQPSVELKEVDGDEAG